MKSKILVLVFMALIGLIPACGLMDQTEEANKMVDEANSMITKNNSLQVRSSLLFSTLLGARLSTVSDIESYKKQNKKKFDELVSVSDESIKLTNELADKFEQASKFRLNEKYKEYLVLKSQEFRKRADADKLVAPIVKLFFETKDTDKWNKEIDDYNKKSEDIMKEAEEIEKKADKIVEDNPTLIK